MKLTCGINSSIIMYKLPFSTVMTYSFILLPEEQMRPRIADPRIGIFYQGYYNIEKEHGLTPLYCARRLAFGAF